MIRIEIKTKGKEQIPKSLIKDIIEIMNKHKYKSGGLTSYRICDDCGCKLANDYPIENSLCPNCEDGELQAKRGHN